MKLFKGLREMVQDLRKIKVRASLEGKVKETIYIVFQYELMNIIDIFP